MAASVSCSNSALRQGTRIGAGCRVLARRRPRWLSRPASRTPNSASEAGTPSALRNSRIHANTAVKPWPGRFKNARNMIHFGFDRSPVADHDVGKHNRRWSARDGYRRARRPGARSNGSRRALSGRPSHPSRRPRTYRRALRDRRRWRTARGRYSLMMRMPSSAMPSASGWKRIDAIGLEAMGERVHAGRHREERRQTDGKLRIFDRHLRHHGGMEDDLFARGSPHW